MTRKTLWVNYFSGAYQIGGRRLQTSGVLLSVELLAGQNWVGKTFSGVSRSNIGGGKKGRCWIQITTFEILMLIYPFTCTCHSYKQIVHPPKYWLTDKYSNSTLMTIHNVNNLHLIGLKKNLAGDFVGKLLHLQMGTTAPRWKCDLFQTCPCVGK